MLLVDSPMYPLADDKYTELALIISPEPRSLMTPLLFTAKLIVLAVILPIIVILPPLDMAKSKTDAEPKLSADPPIFSVDEEVSSI